MKEAIITAKFRMPNAWSEEDTTETGLEPLGGVWQFLQDQGLVAGLTEEASRFGLELLECQVVEVNEQYEGAK